jgi:hypothetical protein
MGNPEESENQPEQNLSRADKRRARIELAKAKAAAKSQRRSAWFAETPLGKWWNPKKEELKQTRAGRVILVFLTLGEIGGMLGAGILLMVGATLVIDTYLFPADYNLTPAQEEEGYGRTVSSGYKSSHPEDVYYRFYTKQDYAVDPDCKKEDAWCVYAISRNKDCHEIFMEFTTRESDSDFSPVLETLESAKTATDGNSFLLGERITLGVVSKDPKANYGSVEHIYCRG